MRNVIFNTPRIDIKNLGLSLYGSWRLGPRDCRLTFIVIQWRGALNLLSIIQRFTTLIILWQLFHAY